MRFKILYIVFLIASTLYANTRVVGSLSPRHILTLLMLLACFIEDKKMWTDRYMNKYLIFTLFFGLSSMLTGYTSQYVSYFLGFVLTAIASYWATKILRVHYDSINVFIYTFLGIGILNAIVTIGQFYSVPVCNMIPNVLRISVDSEFLEDVERGRSLFGLTIPGLMSGDVYNGYFMLIVSILSLWFQKNKLNILGLAPWAISMVALFFIQERAPFYMALAISAFMLYKSLSITKSNLKLIYFIIFFAVAFIGISNLFDYMLSGESRYALGTDDTNRGLIYTSAWNFISDNWLFGGWYYCLDQYNFAPHNLVLNAWIYGGIFGLIAIIVLVFKQCLIIVKEYLSGVSYENYCNLLIGFAFLAYTMNSFLHNKSVVTGDAFIWLLWGAYEIKNISKI